MTRLVTIASVLLALGPVAGAQPRDHGERHLNYDDWMTIGAGALQRGGKKLMVGAHAGQFHELRIQATRGTPLLRRVEVRCVDDTLQTIDVGRRLQPGEELDTDLNCRDCTISSITVIGRPDRDSHVAIAVR